MVDVFDENKLVCPSILVAERERERESVCVCVQIKDDFLGRQIIHFDFHSDTRRPHVVKSLSLLLSYSLSLSHTHTHMHVCPHSLPLFLSLLLSHTHAYKHTLTHTHTLFLSPSPLSLQVPSLTGTIAELGTSVSLKLKDKYSGELLDG